MMKQMPYRVEEGAIDRAKYRAKMAVREAAQPTTKLHLGYTLRWVAASVGAVAMLVLGVVLYYEEQSIDYEDLVSEMQSAPDDIIKEWSRDAIYYPEDINSL